MCAFILVIECYIYSYTHIYIYIYIYICFCLQATELNTYKYGMQPSFLPGENWVMALSYKALDAIYL